MSKRTLKRSRKYQTKREEKHALAFSGKVPMEELACDKTLAQLAQDVL
jgi:hypothetical protein